MSVPDSVGKWGVSGDVLDRALDAAYADPRWSNGHLYPEGWADFEDGLKLAAPIIAEAGYRAAQVEFSARVEALAMEVSGRTYSSAHMFQAIERIVNEIRGLAALTDTEGRDE